MKTLTDYQVNIEIDTNMPAQERTNKNNKDYSKNATNEKLNILNVYEFKT